MGNRMSVNSTHQALATGIATENVEAVRDLLALKPELVRIQVKTREGKHTPLELAAAKGNMQIFCFVFDAAERVYGSWKMGQVVNATSAQGFSLLMLACQSGCSMCARFLLNKGATARCVDAATGRTALHLAVLSSSIGCIEAIFSSEGVAWNDAEMLDFWGRCKFPDMRTMHGMTALHLAACQGDSTAVTVLLRGGAKLDAVIADHHASIPWCSRGSTALHLAASFGHEAVCRALISAQAYHPELDLIRMRNRQGLRAAQCAQLSQQPRIALLLSSHTSNANHAQLEQFAHMVVQADDQPDAAARGVAFRVKILLKLNEMRKEQLTGGSAGKQDGGVSTAAAGGSAEAASAPSLDESRSKRETDEEEEDSDGETDATAVHPLSEEATSGATTSSNATDPFAPFWSVPLALLNTINIRVDLQTICCALATRDAGMSSLISRCLGSSLTDPSDIPEDWQLQVATMALTRAAMIADSFSNHYVNYTTHYLQTSDILLAVGGKIMKASLWPEDESCKHATATGETGRRKEFDDSCRGADEDEDEDEGQCSICMRDEAMVDVQLSPCRHQLCMQCMFEIAYTAIAVDLTCPFCREAVEDVVPTKSSDAGTTESTTTTTTTAPAETVEATSSFPTLPELPSFPSPLELSATPALLPSGVQATPTSSVA